MTCLVKINRRSKTGQFGPRPDKIPITHRDPRKLYRNIKEIWMILIPAILFNKIQMT